jgi:hypothetical protein
MQRFRSLPFSSNEERWHGSTSSIYTGHFIPVVATNYFNDLDPLLDKLDLKEKPDQIWNCDETGKIFEHQPVKVIAAKEEKSVVGRTSASSSNITIMACVNAAGRTMPPLFVATKGKTSKSLHGFNTFDQVFLSNQVCLIEDLDH